MGVPRTPIQLRIIDGELHAVGVGNHVQNVTTALQAYGQQQADHGISTGPSIYTRKIVHALPYLPVIDETRLDMTEKKDNFLERVFSLARWHQSVAGPISVSRLINFHVTHRLTLAAHSDEADEALTETISVLHDPLSHDAIGNYLEQFHDFLRTPLTHKDHIKTLTKLQQRLSPIISSDETEKLNTEVRKYRESPENLTTSLQLIKQLADKYHLYDLSRQAYINPTPAEIALRYSQQ